MPETLEISPTGRFSLPAAAGFGFGPDEGRPPAFDGSMRLAFPVDGGTGYAGAVLRQDGGDDTPVSVTLQLRGGADAGTALDQVARIVSLDHDGAQFDAVGERDEVIGALQRAHPGQRPVLFPSPYEAAAWSVLSARRPAAQGAKVRAALGEQLGTTFEDLGGTTLPAFPQPERLAEIPDAFPGLDAVKIDRLRGVARAALDGELDVARMHALGPEAAYRDLQTLPGIGPFYASLIVLRASGFADAWLAIREHRGIDHAAAYYGVAQTLDTGPLMTLAKRWRPYRTWCLVLIRLAGDRGTTI